MKKLVFRFDIDTHKCIRDGVPNLLKVSEENKAAFTFFLNAGRAVSLTDSLQEVFARNQAESEDAVEMMSAREKLGNKDYLIAALCNPKIASYKSQIKELANSSCEIGLHGGRNHALWHKYAKEWDEEKVEDEIRWGINEVKKVIPDFCPRGFASPGWESPQCLEPVLERLGFEYYSDFQNRGGV